MLDKTCYSFIEELASKAPVPGAGSSCAYVGSLGSALGSMVCNLTLGKKKYAHVQDDIEKIIEKAQIIINRIKNLIEEDMKVFLPLSRAYSMPCDTNEEKEAKRQCIQEALVEAVIVPLKIARCCAEAIGLHEELVIKGTKIMASDVGVGALFCKAALQGSKLNILINTIIMEDSILRDRVLSEIQELCNEYIPIADKIYQKVENELTECQ